MKGSNQLPKQPHIPKSTIPLIHAQKILPLFQHGVHAPGNRPTADLARSPRARRLTRRVPRARSLTRLALQTLIIRKGQVLRRGVGGEDRFDSCCETRLGFGAVGGLSHSKRSTRFAGLGVGTRCRCFGLTSLTFESPVVREGEILGRGVRREDSGDGLSNPRL